MDYRPIRLSIDKPRRRTPIKFALMTCLVAVGVGMTWPEFKDSPVLKAAIERAADNKLRDHFRTTVDHVTATLRGR
ncbi:hypothetical protein [Sphingomonas crocodyli]|uniref:Uncharacterized protein n=1 Tax=Sphingomonas crocodyli TaxID=1979270 RepID=A0A437M8Q4_9SPHN|nr:hypothetical protein [Sphingomonas crocodyli]RVT94108.1 hypothetical protein EOD43_09720 [Sphingomonas crocodyli]